MREQKFHIYLDSHERTILLHSLVELKNQLLPLPTLTTETGTPYGTIPVMYSTDIPQEAQGNTLKKNSSESWNALSANQKKAVGLALLYGYQGNRGSLPGSDDEKWLATQALVWEFVTGCRESTGSYQQTSKKIYNVNFGSNYPNSGAVEVYNQIVSLMGRHNTVFLCFIRQQSKRGEVRRSVHHHIGNHL